MSISRETAYLYKTTFYGLIIRGELLYQIVFHTVSNCLPYCIKLSSILYQIVFHTVSNCLPYCIRLSSILYQIVFHTVSDCLPYCIKLSSILYQIIFHTVSDCLPYCIKLSSILYQIVFHMTYLYISIFRGSVANMLVTSCIDNVCRLWVETILPDDGLVDLEQFDPSSSFDPKFHTQRHKKRFMQRLKTIRYIKVYMSILDREIDNIESILK